ncbi:MAG: M15 family metallopeptidase [Planctomycetota bacterium]|jgi:LAS superfamily LD-carboxypeptidase LdcB
MMIELWKDGKSIGMAEYEYIGNAKVLKIYAPILRSLIADAKKNGVDISIAKGIRTFIEQLDLRKRNVIDKTKVNDIIYLKTASPKLFNPETGRPGFSNHGPGIAYDFNVTNPKGGTLPSYEWLVKNAFRYNKLVRTVPSERWHWEFRLEAKDMFFKVPKDHFTWDKLV